MSIYSFKLNLKEGSGAAHWPVGMFKYIQKFSIHSLKNNEIMELTTNRDQEMGVLILEGLCDLFIEGKEYKGIGSRKSVFDGLPSAIYIPLDTKLTLIGKGVTVAICAGKCMKKTRHALIRQKDIREMWVGKDNWRRLVRIIIGPNGPSANLILGETINPPGNWSGTPPHKHELNNLPAESLHEELYYFKIDRPLGWGIQRIYSPSKKLNELLYLENNTMTFMPSGYHQVVSGPGYTLYYMFFLTGKGNLLCGYEDPEHNWIKK